MYKAVKQQENKKRYQDFIRLSESAAMQGMDAILNEFLFFCSFAKGPAQDFLYRRLTDKPCNQYPILNASYSAFKGCARTLLNFVSHRIVSKGPIVKGVIESKTNILICSWLWDANLLLDNRLDNEDRYFGKLGSRLKEQGFKIQYFLTPVSKKVATESLKYKELSNNLIVYANNVRPSLKDLRILTRNSKKYFETGMTIDEHISYVSGFCRSRYILSRQLYANFMNMFRESNIKYILIPWENQPQQKAVCLAAHASGIKVLGYCHAAINGSYVHLINNNWAWCPDAMLLNGFGYVPLLDDMGWKNNINVIRAFRYQNPPVRSSFEGKAFLPYDVEDSIATLKTLKSMVSAHNYAVKEIRCHPINVNHPQIKDLIDEIPKKQDATDIYVGGFSSVLFEALQAGCTVYSIQKDALNSENAYEKFNKIKVTRINQFLLKFEPIGDMTDYFFCFDEDRSFKLTC